MMQVLDHLLMSPPLKPQSVSDSPSFLSDSFCNTSADGSQTSQQDSPSNSKTLKNQNVKAKSSLCRNFMERGCCPYGSKCQFAHGLSQLRFNSDQNLYKTRQCNAYIKNCVCMYGNRCNFLHSGQVVGEQQEIGINKVMGYREITSRWAGLKQSRLLNILSSNISHQGHGYKNTN